MDNKRRFEPAGEKTPSRRKFIASVGMAGMAAVAGGLLTGNVYGSSVNGAVYGENVGLTVEGSGDSVFVQHYQGTLDAEGKIMFTHGKGSPFPANVLMINAFIKLPNGSARNVNVDYVDDVHISVSVGVPGAAVRVGVLYTNTNFSW